MRYRKAKKDNRRPNKPRKTTQRGYIEVKSRSRKRNEKTQQGSRDRDGSTVTDSERRVRKR